MNDFDQIYLIQNIQKLFNLLNHTGHCHGCLDVVVDLHAEGDVVILRRSTHHLLGHFQLFQLEYLHYLAKNVHEEGEEGVLTHEDVGLGTFIVLELGG